MGRDHTHLRPHPTKTARRWCCSPTPAGESPSEFMAHCSARWAYFLLSLKSLLETGKGTPFPEDLKF